MELSWGSIFIGLDACLMCGSFHLKRGQLCLPCFHLLQSRAELCSREVTLAGSKPILLTSLFEWIPQESDFVSKFFLLLKGEERRRAWEVWAQIFLKEFVSRQSLNSPFIFIPCPSRSGKSDHAYFWGKALAREFQGEFHPALLHSKDDQGPQKRKKLQDRLAGVKSRSEKFTLCEGYRQRDLQSQWRKKRIIFTDDILTTGATALRAFEALGGPPSFEVWCLGYRTSLASLFGV